MTESQLAERCCQGDREAQHDLYAQTCDRIYRLLLRMTRDPEDALDLTQSTYVRVFERIHQFDRASHLTTWVYRIAVNEALQFLRSRKRRQRREVEHTQAVQPVHEADAADARMDVAEALARLTDDERALILLRHFDDLSYAEMAEVLGQPSGTVGSELNRARRKLRDFLASPGSPMP